MEKKIQSGNREIATREIKFRFWTGIEMRQPNLNTFLLSTNGSLYWQFGYDDITPIPDWIQMQYVGLKDKKGNEAFEGDICRYISKYRPVKLFKIFRVPGGFAVNTHQDDFYKPVEQIVFYDGLSDMQTYSWFTGNLEIIGNVFENPELLTK